MYEHFDERARQCVVLAQEEARRLGHADVGTVHLVLGIGAVDEGMLGVELERIRAAVVALLGNGPKPTSGMLPFSAEAIAAVTGANTQALSLGHTTIDPAHLLLALLDAGGSGARALREAGAIPSELRERASAVAGSPPAPSPGPRPAGTPQPEVPDPHPDVRLLERMLLDDTPVARMLRDHGIDEVLLRELFGLPASGA